MRFKSGQNDIFAPTTRQFCSARFARRLFVALLSNFWYHLCLSLSLLFKLLKCGLFSRIMILHNKVFPLNYLNVCPKCAPHARTRWLSLRCNATGWYKRLTDQTALTHQLDLFWARQLSILLSAIFSKNIKYHYATKLLNHKLMMLKWVIWQ